MKTLMNTFLVCATVCLFGCGQGKRDHGHGHDHGHHGNHEHHEHDEPQKNIVGHSQHNGQIEENNDIEEKKSIFSKKTNPQKELNVSSPGVLTDSKKTVEKNSRNEASLMEV